MYPFKPGSYAPKNGWYVAAFCEEIGEKLLSRWILNHPVVLYRKADGTAVAVEGRCPHRHFPLGESKRVGDAIQCGYHGITFGADGKCTLVPSQKTVPGVYSIKAYPLVERGLWAWIWPGDPDKADESLLPTMEEIGYRKDPDFHAKPFYYHHVNGRYQLLNDNLLDLTHIGYLHGTSIGTVENASTPEELTRAPRFFGSRRVIRNADPVIGWLRKMDEGLYARETPDGWPLDAAAWTGPGQMETRFEIAKAIGNGSARLFHAREPGGGDEPAFPQLQNALWYGGFSRAIGPQTKAVLDRAGSSPQWNMLLLASPEFMAR